MCRLLEERRSGILATPASGEQARGARERPRHGARETGRSGRGSHPAATRIESGAGDHAAREQRPRDVDRHARAFRAGISLGDARKGDRGIDPEAERGGGRLPPRSSPRTGPVRRRAALRPCRRRRFETNPVLPRPRSPSCQEAPPCRRTPCSSPRQTRVRPPAARLRYRAPGHGRGTSSRSAWKSGQTCRRGRAPHARTAS